MARVRTIYDTPEWRRVRKVVLERDGHQCRLRCSRRCRGVATTVDHIVRPEEGGLPFDPQNLQAACVSCNPAKGQILMAARARMYDRASLQRW